MSKCCFCLPVTTGAIVLGVLGLLIVTAEVVPIIPFLTDSDVFNPIKDNIERSFYLLEQILEEQQLPEDEINNLLDIFKKSLWYLILSEAVASSVYGLFCLMMIFGVAYKKRGLMVPYMVYQMICLVFFIIVGVAGTILFFFINIIMGVVFGVVVLVVSSLTIYFWIVVQRGYIEIGRYSNYSPAPSSIQPIYNPSRHHPATPQHFKMNDSTIGK